VNATGGGANAAGGGRLSGGALLAPFAIHRSAFRIEISRYACLEKVAIKRNQAKKAMRITEMRRRQAVVAPLMTTMTDE
jgi:hypothetical protein